MPQPTLHYHPSLDTSASTSDSSGSRPSLYDAKDAFIERIGPVAVAAIYFGGFSLAPQDAALSRQALFKLSFLHRHFLHPAGVRIVVDKQTAVISGKLSSRLHYRLAEILAHQIEGIRFIKDATEKASMIVAADHESARESIEFLYVIDQTLRTGVQVHIHGGRLVLEGELRSDAQKNWAEQLADAVVGSSVDSKLRVSASSPAPLAPVSEPPQIDDESLQALVLFRLHLVRETEHLPIKAKASRGVVTLQGKVRTEALRQRVENVVRSTLGIRELRSSLSVTG